MKKKRKQYIIPKGLRVPKVKVRWYPDELKFIQDNFRTLTDAQLLSRINHHRSEQEQIRIGSLRFQRGRMGCNRMTQPRWNQREIKFLKKCYTFIGDIELAEHLTAMSKKGRIFTKKNIDKKLGLLALKRTVHQRKRIMEDHKICGSFKHGKTWKTRREAKEQETRIWNSNGRKVRFIKINGRFIPYARWDYENHIGPIPKGYQVYHKDGDNLNDLPDNYELLAGKDIVIRRNSIRKKYSEQQPVQASSTDELFDPKTEWI